MAANLSWSTLGKATDLRQRIFFTIGLLIVYRLGTYIPVPGIDAVELAKFMETASQGIGGMLQMFTGGALGRMGIFALGNTVLKILDLGAHLVKLGIAFLSTLLNMLQFCS